MNDRNDATPRTSGPPDDPRGEEELTTAELAEGSETHDEAPARSSLSREPVDQARPPSSAVPAGGAVERIRDDGDPESVRTRAAATTGVADGMRTAHEETPAAATAAPSAGDTSGAGDGPQALFSEDTSARYRLQWDEVQASFVDEPRSAVQQADSLVAQLMKELAQTFADERAGLESQWDRGADVSTEDLRIALQRYRSFFDRLLSL